MTADTFHPSFAPKIFDRIPAMGMPRLVSILDFVKYASVFAAYVAIFVISFMTVGFLEIRQANMGDFNALIAMLEQRDGYADRHLDKELERLRGEIRSYALTLNPFACPEEANSIKPASDRSNGDQGASSASLKTCAEAKEAARQHYIE